MSAMSNTAQKSARKVIGFYDESEGPGGTTRYLQTLIKGIDRAEFHLVFLALKRRQWHQQLESMGIEIITLLNDAPPASIRPVATGTNSTPPPGRSASALSWWKGTVRETLSLIRLFRKRRIDLLHSNQAGAEPAPIAARIAAIPVVIATWHVDSTYDLDNIRGGARYRLLEKACMRSLHHAIAVSGATADDWMRRCNLPDSYREKLSVIHNGIDVDSLVRTRTTCEAKEAEGFLNRLIIGSMGRLEQAKGYEYLIRALTRVVQDWPEVLVRIAGRGELQETLEKLALDLGVTRNVEFCGFTSDIRSFLESIDVYVQPSLCETQGLAILEACAVGAPVIASRVGGIPECVQDGVTGMLVPARDAESMATTILALASDLQLRQKMAAAGLQRVRDQFRYEGMVEKTIAVYRALLPSVH